MVDALADGIDGPWDTDPLVPSEDHVYARVLFPYHVNWFGQDPAKLQPNKDVIRNTGEGDRRGMSCDWSRYRSDPSVTRRPNTQNFSIDQYGVFRINVGIIRGFFEDQVHLRQDVKHDPVFEAPRDPRNNRAHSLAVGQKGKSDKIPDFERTAIRQLYATNAEWVTIPEQKYWPENHDE